MTVAGGYDERDTYYLTRQSLLAAMRGLLPRNRKSSARLKGPTCRSNRPSICWAFRAALFTGGMICMSTAVLMRWLTAHPSMCDKGRRHPSCSTHLQRRPAPSAAAPVWRRVTCAPKPADRLRSSRPAIQYQPRSLPERVPLFLKGIAKRSREEPYNHESDIGRFSRLLKNDFERAVHGSAFS